MEAAGTFLCVLCGSCEGRGYELAAISTVDDFRAVREAVGTLSVRIAAWIGLRSQQDKGIQQLPRSNAVHRAYPVVRHVTSQ